MIFTTVCRYCNQLILFEIFDIPFEKKKEYRYYLSSEEINDLGVKDESEIIFGKNIKVDFDFQVSVFKKEYNGTIYVSSNLIDNGSLENSYYLNKIELKSNNDIKLYPFFLNEKGMNTLISEFIHKLWIPILVELTKKEEKKELNLLKEIKTPLLDKEIKAFIKIDENEELVFDVFYIVSSYLYKSKVLPLNISVTDIMKNRGLIQNKNANGYRGGYKNEQKIKVHAALNILNSANLLNVYEVSQFNYIILPSLIFNNFSAKSCNINLVKFNYKTQLNERNIANYLLNSKKEKIKIKDLINLIQITSKSLKPTQLRDKLENIMDNLSNKDFIKSWHYLKINEDELYGKNWLEKWLELFIICRY